MTSREPAPFHLDEIRQACFAQLRGAISNDAEWRKHLDWAFDRLAREAENGPFTPAERVYLDALAVAGIQKNDIPSVRRILGGVLRRDPDDFFFLYLDLKLSNLLGLDSPSLSRVENLLAVAQTSLDVPGFEFLPPRGECSPALSIAVSTWNRRDSLAILVESVRRNTISPYELIVYDNRSSDGTQEYLRATRNDLPELGVVFSQGHRSTIRAYKLLFQLAQADLMGALADDVEVLPGWDTALLEASGRTGGVGEVTPLALATDGTIRYTASCIPYMSRRHDWMNLHGRVPNRRGVRPTEAGLPPEAIEVEGGAYPFVRRSVFMRTSMVDERFLHVWDNDLALEIRSQGLSNKLCPAGRILDHARPSDQVLARGESEHGLSERLYLDPTRAMELIRGGSTPALRYFHDDLLHQCKWRAWRIEPCNV
ncbi:MAG: glycosyltransferase family 2 protein [Nitrospirae bacterium]|nr:glycosyltransferase family 2 protein [Nitrospirota bacterium]